jgi:hypothetical protein
MVVKALGMDVGDCLQRADRGFVKTERIIPAADIIFAQV